MNILLDTNIVVDIISCRDGYIDSLNILKSCEAKRLDGFVSTITITDVMYILRRYNTPELLRTAIQDIMSIIEVVDVTKADIHFALSSEMQDFEDAVQASCAKRNKFDYIVSRNIPDFVKSPVPAILPSDSILAPPTAYT
jgi:predicted nucleic acid-binding protein